MYELLFSIALDNLTVMEKAELYDTDIYERELNVYIKEWKITEDGKIDQKVVDWTKSRMKNKGNGDQL